MSSIGPKMKQFALITTAVAALTLIAALVPTHPAAAQDPDNGRHLYSFYGCIECHGPEAQGDVGPKIGAISISLEEFLTQIRTPREQMDAYPADFLSDGQAADIYTLLQTLP